MDRDRAQITLICASAPTTFLHQPTAPIGGYVRASVVDNSHPQ
jgi:hypothetical protein